MVKPLFGPIWLLYQNSSADVTTRSTKIPVKLCAQQTIQVTARVRREAALQTSPTILNHCLPVKTTMASSAPKIAEEERYEDPEVIDRKAQALVDQMKKARHFIAFTGAGISTSAG